MTSPQLYLLDTDITGYIVRGRSPSARMMLRQTLEDARVGISVVTEAEILFGLELRPEASRLRASVERLLQAIEILDWNARAAAAYARIRAQLKLAGKPLAEMDLLIAAHAVALDAVLVSHDKAFQLLTHSLRVIDSATDLE